MALKEGGLLRVMNVLHGRAQDYRDVFSCPAGERVLADLARFCRAHESTFNAEARAHAVAEGRREVWLRIERNLQLNDEQIWALYGLGKPEN